MRDVGNLTRKNYTALSHLHRELLTSVAFHSAFDGRRESENLYSSTAGPREKQRVPSCLNRMQQIFVSSQGRGVGQPQRKLPTA